MQKVAGASSVLFWLGGLRREEGGLINFITLAQFNISHKDIL